MGEDGQVPHRWRQAAIGVVVARIVVPLAAVPLIPFLVRDNIALLVLLRPQKEFLLVGGGLTRFLGEPGVPLLLAAYLPLGVLAIPAFFLLGRSYRTALEQRQGVAWLHRALPPTQLCRAQQVLARRGVLVALLGRFAAMPPTVLAAAAGTSQVSPARYLLADAAGALLSFAAVIGAGFALGRAYEDGGVWLTAAGVALLALFLALFTRWLQRDTDAAGTPM